MHISKLGHCCLVLEVGDTKIVTDPGLFTTAQDAMQDIDILLITHEHGDHFHVPSVSAIVKNNPEVEVVCNKAVAALIAKENMPCKVNVVEDAESVALKNISIEGFGHDHAAIYGDMGKVENTGYMVNEKFYFPGDNFHAPGKKVEVLALPVAGPWMKISEAIDFAKAVNPNVAFGVHDGMMKPEFNFNAGMAGTVLGGQYVKLQDGESREF